MTIKRLHSWTLEPNQAIQLQESLRKLLVLTWDGRAVNSIGGVDVRCTGKSARITINVLDHPEMIFRDGASLDATLTFPYIPGLLVFRLGPSILAAWQKLKRKPDVLMVHSHGTAHPRGLGLASHLGLWLNMPTIGIAKTRLYGIHADPGPLPGDWSEVRDENNPGSVIGAVLRTRMNTKPIYVSPGHLIDLQLSMDFVLASCRGFRLPEPMRMTNQAATSRFSCP
jgi:deoxyribonuclease V